MRKNYPTGTLCSKHGSIEDILIYIQDNSTEFAHEIEEALTHIKNCLDDGNRMESKLKDRKKEADDFEKTIYELEKTISNLESEIESKNYDIKSLESEISNNQ